MWVNYRAAKMIKEMKALTYEVGLKGYRVCSPMKLLPRNYGISLCLRVVNPQRGICRLVKGALLRRK